MKTFKRRIAPATLALAMLTSVVAACSPTPTTPTGPTAQEQFCKVWDKVADAPPTATDAVLVKSDVVALAEGTTVTGSSCTASNAKVALDGATLAEGTEVLAEKDTDKTDKLAAVTGDEISAGQPVLDNVTVNPVTTVCVVVTPPAGLFEDLVDEDPEPAASSDGSPEDAAADTDGN